MTWEQAIADIQASGYTVSQPEPGEAVVTGGIGTVRLVERGDGCATVNVNGRWLTEKAFVALALMFPRQTEER